MFYVILAIAVLIALQIGLSMKKSKFIGLIQPAITIIMLITALVGRAYKIALLLGLFFLVLLLIYFMCQRKIIKKKKNDISKMKISDL